MLRWVGHFYGMATRKRKSGSEAREAESIAHLKFDTPEDYNRFLKGGGGMGKKKRVKRVKPQVTEHNGLTKVDDEFFSYHPHATSLSNADLGATIRDLLRCAHERAAVTRASMQAEKKAEPKTAEKSEANEKKQAEKKKRMRRRMPYDVHIEARPGVTKGLRYAAQSPDLAPWSAPLERLASHLQMSKISDSGTGAPATVSYTRAIMTYWPAGRSEFTPHKFSDKDYTGCKSPIVVTWAGVGSRTLVFSRKHIEKDKWVPYRSIQCQKGACLVLKDEAFAQIKFSVAQSAAAPPWIMITLLPIAPASA